MLTELFLKWFGEQPNLIASFQVALDILILIALLLFFLFGKRQKNSPGTEELVQSLEGIIEETKSIGKEFETNLQERQVLIQQLLTKLDQRVSDAQRVCDLLGNLQKVQPTVADPSTHLLSQSETRKVLLLSQKGLDANAIAKRLQKPVGEVELILNIQRMSSDG